MDPTDEHEIINVTKKLKSSTSEGFDNISMKIIKQCLLHIFSTNRS